MTDLLDRSAQKAGTTAAKKTGKAVLKKLLTGWGIVIALVIGLIFMGIAALSGSSADPTSATSAPAQTGSITAPAGADVTVQHAAQIVNVAYGRGLGRAGAVIGVAVASAESSLQNYANDGTSTDYGYFAEGHRQLNDAERAVARASLQFPHDTVGHNLDSMGLFQQRPSAGWGTPAELMDPTAAAGKFYDALIKVAGWQNLDPATAAQDVQGSNDADGQIYRDAISKASGIVDQLGAAAPGGTPPGGAAPITGGVQVAIPAGQPVSGFINAPTPTVAKAMSAGFAWIGETYSWAGGDEHGPTLGICGPDGAENDCHIVGFDCSGLMFYMWSQVGITLPRYSQDQLAAGQQIPWAQRQPGDMIGYPGHITMFLGTFDGTDYMYEAPYSGAYLRITTVRSGHDDNVSRVWQGK